MNGGTRVEEEALLAALATAASPPCVERNLAYAECSEVLESAYTRCGEVTEDYGRTFYMGACRVPAVREPGGDSL